MKDGPLDTLHRTFLQTLYLPPERNRPSPHADGIIDPARRAMDDLFSHESPLVHHLDRPLFERATTGVGDVRMGG